MGRPESRANRRAAAMTRAVPTDITTGQVLDRLERLERENRRYKLSAAALGLACFGWVACGLVPQAKTTLSAERIVLLDSAGGEKAILEVDSKGNPMLVLRNKESTAVLTTDGPSLLLRGPDGKTSAFMSIDSKNTARLELTSHRLLDGVRLTAHADGSSGVYVLDTDGRNRGGLEAFGPGGAALNVRDGVGRVRGSLGLDANHVPNLLLLDAEGARRVGLIVQEDGNALLEVSDDRGRPRAQLSTQFDGSPVLEMKREDGSPSFHAP
jgi:hypothetical protein